MTASKEDIILEELRQIRKTQLKHVADIAALKVKTGLWAAVVSAVVSISTIAVVLWS